MLNYIWTDHQIYWKLTTARPFDMVGMKLSYNLSLPSESKVNPIGRNLVWNQISQLLSEMWFHSLSVEDETALMFTILFGKAIPGVW